MKSLSIRRYRRSTQDLSASAAPQGVLDAIVAVARHGVQSPHVSEAFIVVFGYLSKDVGYRATDRLRADLVGHCLRLDLSFHQTQSWGMPCCSPVFS